MSAQLDELYFEWLYSQIGSVRLKNPARTYWNLCRLLFTKEFVWLVPNDDNRIADGKNLRYEFLEAKGIDRVDKHWMDMGCSMFELFIVLARILAFEAEGEPYEWFWELCENLDLRDYNDRVEIPKDHVEDILDRIIWRTYRRSGRGGLFPLKRAERDQRDVELWYQLCAYLLERS